MEQTGGPPLTKKWVGKHYLGKGARCAAADGHDDDPETQETVTVWRGARTAAASAHSSGCPNDRRLICTTRGPQPPKHPPPLAVRRRKSRSPRRDVSPSTSPDHGAQFRPRPPKLNTRRGRELEALPLSQLATPPRQSESNPVPHNFHFDLTDVPLEDTLLCASSHNVFFYQAHEQLSESK